MSRDGNASWQPSTTCGHGVMVQDRVTVLLRLASLFPAEQLHKLIWCVHGSEVKEEPYHGPVGDQSDTTPSADQKDMHSQCQWWPWGWKQLPNMPDDTLAICKWHSAWPALCLLAVAMICGTLSIIGPAWLVMPKGSVCRRSAFKQPKGILGRGISKRSK